jgi:hypothetical protein
MMRAWKKEWSVDIGGLLIDTLAYQFIENYEYRDKSYLYYDFLCRDCFKWISDVALDDAEPVRDARRNDDHVARPGPGRLLIGV